MKTLLCYLSLAAFLVLAAKASLALAPFGAADAPLHRETSAAGTPGAASYYIHSAYRDAHTDNIVTVILGDYRSFDTFGEALVVFTAGVCAVLILKRPK